MDIERLATFDAAENAYQAFSDIVLFSDLTCPFLLADGRRIQVYVRASGALGQLLGVCYELLGAIACELSKVFQKDMLYIHELRETIDVAD